MPTFAMLVGELWENFVAVDRKLLRTIRMLLLQPGAATAEHLSGKRAATVSPYKIFFWTTALLVFVLNFGFFIEDKSILESVSDNPTTEQSKSAKPNTDRPGNPSRDSSVVFRVNTAKNATSEKQPTIAGQTRKNTRPPNFSLADFFDRPVTVLGVSINPANLPRSVPEYEAAQQKRPLEKRDAPLRHFLSIKWIRLRDEPADFVRNLIYGSVPNILLITAPSWAACFLPFFRKPRRRFVEHLVFSLHSHTVGIWLVLCGLLVEGMHQWVKAAPQADPDTVFAVIALTGAVHTFLAAKKVYGLSPWALLMRGGCLNLLYVALALFAILIGMTFTLLWNLIGL